MFEEKDPIFEENNQKKLIEQIQTAPDCKIFGVSRFNQGMIRRTRNWTILIAIVLIVLAFIFLNPDLAVILFILTITITLIIYAILSYLNHSHKYFKVFVSELGIAKTSEWDKGAIPWDKLEFIEIKNKGKIIDFINFRAGLTKVGYRNSFFATRLSLEIISEYIGGFDNWIIIDDLKETAETTNSDRFYMRPDFEESKGQKRLEALLLMEWIGEQDYDAHMTKEQISHKSDDELYALILNDRQCECLHDDGRLGRILGNFKLTFVMLVVATAGSIGGMFLIPFSGIIYTGVVLLFILMIYGMCKGDEKLVISPIGITRFLFGSPEALEWQHVEYIDFEFEEGKLIQVEFFGNKRRIFCPRHTYKDKFSMDMIRKYLPNIDTWEKKTRSDWREDVYRLVRPDD